MPIDFKASQVRTSKIIASGSATRPYLLIYPSGAASNDSGGTQKLTGTGSDTWLFISGANGTGTDRVVFGGAVFVSGGMIVNRQAGGGGPTIDGNFATGDFLLLNSSAQYLVFGDVSSSRVGIDSGAPSGTLHIGDGDGATPGLVVDDTAIVNYGRNSDNVSTFLVRRSSTHADHDSLFVVSSSNDRVGIRKHQPQATLDVSGSVMVTGSMYISGNIYAQEFHTNIISASIIYESGSTKFGDSSDDVHQFTGSAYFKDPLHAAKISGSLTTLTDGNPYLIAGSNISLTTGSNGAVTITSTGGGGGTPGGAAGQVQFNDGASFAGSPDFVFLNGPTNVGIGVSSPVARLHVSGILPFPAIAYTGSLRSFEGPPGIIAGNSTNPIAMFGVSGTLASPKTLGSDVFFFVSGNITKGLLSTPDYTKRGTSVFGGDVVISGSLYGGSPLRIGSEIDAPFGFSGVVPFNSIVTTGAIISSASLDVKNSGTGLPVFNASNSGAVSGSGDFLVGGNVVLAGDITSDTSEAKSIFGNVVNNINLGGQGSTTIVGNLSTSGDITVNGNDIKSSTSATALQLTGSGVTVSGNLIGSGSLEVKGSTVLSGSVSMPQGLSGSLTRLSNGASYLIAGSNVTITSASNGSVTISSAGGTASTTGSFNDLGSKFVTTASVSIAGGQGFSYSVSSVGDDVYFFVSGSTAAGSGQSVFGGNVVVSGALAATNTTIGGGYGATGVTISPAGNISANGTLTVDGKATFGGDISADTNEAKIIFSEVTTNSITIGGSPSSTLVAGGNDIRGTAAGSLRVGVASAQVLVLSGGAASSTNPINFADTNFHVSGSVGSLRTQTRGTSNFGGDVHVSGGFAYGHEVFATRGIFTSAQPTGSPGTNTTAAQLDGYRYVRFGGDPTTTPTCSLPTAASDRNRVLTIINDMSSPADSLLLSSSNSNILGKNNNDWTFILAATGSWVEILSDGTSWVIVNGGVIPVQGVSQ